MLQRRPNTFAQTILSTLIFRLRQSGGPYIPGCPSTDKNPDLVVSATPLTPAQEKKLSHVQVFRNAAGETRKERWQHD